MSGERFEDSPEFEDWFENTGCRDEDHDEHYYKWERRVDGTEHKEPNEDW